MIRTLTILSPVCKNIAVISAQVKFQHEDCAINVHYHVAYYLLSGKLFNIVFVPQYNYTYNIRIKEDAVVCCSQLSFIIIFC